VLAATRTEAVQAGVREVWLLPVLLRLLLMPFADPACERVRREKLKFKRMI
jgi:hypothetical protein